VALVVFGLLTSASAADFTWQQVGSIGNAANPATGLGRVTENFKISAFETTISQYADFLNNSVAGKQGLYGVYNKNIGSVINASTPLPTAVAITRSGSAGDYIYSVESGFADKPVNNVNWFSAARFVNWYANGHDLAASSETGSYTLVGGQDSGNIVARNADAKVFLPNANEWTKAAFYNPATQSYSTWPTQSNTQPTPTLPVNNEQITTENTAKFRSGSAGTVKMTNAGTYVNTTSTYGLFDLTGNVNEMTDTAQSGTASKFQALGGSFATDATTMDSFYSSAKVGEFKIADNAVAAIGFRVAAVAVPEPGNMVAAAMGIAGLVAVQLAKRRKLALAQVAG
jgi:formylglycine-generating enzyme required for sulfatase activity